MRRSSSGRQYRPPRGSTPTAQAEYMSNSASGTSSRLSRKMSSGSAKKPALVNTSPNARILRHITECAQCST